MVVCFVLPSRGIEGSTMLDFQYFQLILFGLFIAKERLVIAIGRLEEPRSAAFFRDSAQEEENKERKKDKRYPQRAEPTNRLKTQH